MTDPYRATRWRLAHGRELEIGPKARLMGILNVTPDSFSDGGRFAGETGRAVEAALQMVADGADIIDIGGESTRPDAEETDPETERARVVPVIEALRGRSDCLISIDTYRAATAQAALEAGAHIVNDVWAAQREPEIAAVAARFGAGLCLMHNGRGRDRLSDVVADQATFLAASLEIAGRAGVEAGRIVLDPGFGFAKSADENFELLRRFPEIPDFGRPWLVGTSRKRFVRGAVPDGASALDRATAASSVLLRERGAAIFRVHDVKANRDALAFTDAAFGRPWGATR